MKAGEKNLLLAVRNQLRAAVNSGGAGFGTVGNVVGGVPQCDVELDEMAPATVGQLYVSVTPGGWRYGPNHSKSGGVRDIVYGVNVVVIKRIGNVARDRLRDVFINNLDALDAEIDLAIQAIDWQYAVTNAANTLITAETSSTEGFIHPLTLDGQVGPPRLAPAEMFGASGDNRAGLMRTIPFHNARRITTVN